MKAKRCKCGGKLQPTFDVHQETQHVVGANWGCLNPECDCRVPLLARDVGVWLTEIMVISFEKGVDDGSKRSAK